MPGQVCAVQETPMQSIATLALATSLLATPSAELQENQLQQTSDNPTQQCQADMNGYCLYFTNQAVYSLQQELQSLLAQSFTPQVPELIVEVIEESTQSAVIDQESELTSDTTEEQTETVTNEASKSGQLVNYQVFSQSSGSGLDHGLLYNLVNQYRQENNLPVFSEDNLTCQIASERLPELYSEIVGPIPMHQGLKNKTWF